MGQDGQGGPEALGVWAESQGGELHQVWVQVPWQ